MDELLFSCIEEIALEGLQGCSLDQLWLLVSGVSAMVLDDHLKGWLWKELVQRPEVEFHEAQMSLPWKPKKEELAALRGKLDFVRTPVSRADVNKRLVEIDDAFGDRLRVCAIDSVRERFLGIDKFVSKSINRDSYVILEEIGRSRRDGRLISTLCHELAVDNRMFFYRTKCLVANNLIAREYVMVANDTAPNRTRTNIVHLRRFAPATPAEHDALLDRLGLMPLPDQKEMTEALLQTLRDAPDHAMVETDLLAHMATLNGIITDAKKRRQRFTSLRDNLVKEGRITKFLTTNEDGKQLLCVGLAEDDADDAQDQGDDIGPDAVLELTPLGQVYNAIADAGNTGQLQYDLQRVCVIRDVHVVPKIVEQLEAEYGIVKVQEQSKRNVQYRVFLNSACSQGLERLACEQRIIRRRGRTIDDTNVSIGDAVLATAAEGAPAPMVLEHGSTTATAAAIATATATATLDVDALHPPPAPIMAARVVTAAPLATASVAAGASVTGTAPGGSTSLARFELIAPNAPAETAVHHGCVVLVHARDANVDAGTKQSANTLQNITRKRYILQRLYDERIVPENDSWLLEPLPANIAARIASEGKRIDRKTLARLAHNMCAEGLLRRGTVSMELFKRTLSTPVLIAPGVDIKSEEVERFVLQLKSRKLAPRMMRKPEKVTEERHDIKVERRYPLHVPRRDPASINMVARNYGFYAPKMTRLSMLHKLLWQLAYDPGSLDEAAKPMEGAASSSSQTAVTTSTAAEAALAETAHPAAAPAEGRASRKGLSVAVPAIDEATAESPAFQGLSASSVASLDSLLSALMGPVTPSGFAMEAASGAGGAPAFSQEAINRHAGVQLSLEDIVRGMTVSLWARIVGVLQTVPGLEKQIEGGAKLSEVPQSQRTQVFERWSHFRDFLTMLAKLKLVTLSEGGYVVVEKTAVLPGTDGAVRSVVLDNAGVVERLWEHIKTLAISGQDAFSNFRSNPQGFDPSEVSGFFVKRNWTGGNYLPRAQRNMLDKMWKPNLTREQLQDIAAKAKIGVKHVENYYYNEDAAVDDAIQPAGVRSVKQPRLRRGRGRARGGRSGGGRASRASKRSRKLVAASDDGDGSSASEFEPSESVSWEASVSDAQRNEAGEDEGDEEPDQEGTATSPAGRIARKIPRQGDAPTAHASPSKPRKPRKKNERSAKGTRAIRPAEGAATGGDETGESGAGASGRGEPTERSGEATSEEEGEGEGEGGGARQRRVRRRQATTRPSHARKPGNEAFVAPRDVWAVARGEAVPLAVPPAAQPPHKSRKTRATEDVSQARDDRLVWTSSDHVTLIYVYVLLSARNMLIADARRRVPGAAGCDLIAPSEEDIDWDVCCAALVQLGHWAQDGAVEAGKDPAKRPSPEDCRRRFSSACHSELRHGVRLLVAERYSLEARKGMLAQPMTAEEAVGIVRAHGPLRERAPMALPASVVDLETAFRVVDFSEATSWAEQWSFVAEAIKMSLNTPHDLYSSRLAHFVLRRYKLQEVGHAYDQLCRAGHIRTTKTTVDKRRIKLSAEYRSFLMPYGFPKKLLDEVQPLLRRARREGAALAIEVAETLFRTCAEDSAGSAEAKAGMSSAKAVVPKELTGGDLAAVCHLIADRKVKLTPLLPPTYRYDPEDATREKWFCEKHCTISVRSEVSAKEYTCGCRGEARPENFAEASGGVPWDSVAVRVDGIDDLPLEMPDVTEAPESPSHEALGALARSAAQKRRRSPLPDGDGGQPAGEETTEADDDEAQRAAKRARRSSRASEEDATSVAAAVSAATAAVEDGRAALADSARASLQHVLGVLHTRLGFGDVLLALTAQLYARIYRAGEAGVARDVLRTEGLGHMRAREEGDPGAAGDAERVASCEAVRQQLLNFELVVELLLYDTTVVVATPFAAPFCFPHLPASLVAPRGEADPLPGLPVVRRRRVRGPDGQLVGPEPPSVRARRRGPAAEMATHPTDAKHRDASEAHGDDEADDGAAALHLGDGVGEAGGTESAGGVEADTQHPQPSAASERTAQLTAEPERGGAGGAAPVGGVDVVANVPQQRRVGTANNVMLPWMSINGEPNEPLLKSLRERLMTLIMKRPGIYEEDVTKDGLPMFAPETVRHLLASMTSEGLLVTRYVPVAVSTLRGLFASAAPPRACYFPSTRIDTQVMYGQ